METFRQLGQMWIWSPERWRVRFQASQRDFRPPLPSDTYELILSWGTYGGERLYSFQPHLIGTPESRLRSLDDVQAVAEVALEQVRQGRAPRGWDLIMGKRFASDAAESIWDGVVAEVARAHSDPERVRRVAASMQPTTLPQIAHLLGEMITKSRTTGGAR